MAAFVGILKGPSNMSITRLILIVMAVFVVLMLLKVIRGTPRR